VAEPTNSVVCSREARGRASQPRTRAKVDGRCRSGSAMVWGGDGWGAPTMGMRVLTQRRWPANPASAVLREGTSTARVGMHRGTCESGRRVRV
jgi:hypothetical protein